MEDEWTIMNEPDYLKRETLVTLKVPPNILLSLLRTKFLNIPMIDNIDSIKLGSMDLLLHNFKNYDLTFTWKEKN